MAYVLCYELVFGEGIKPFGPAERALLQASDSLLNAVELLKQQNGKTDLAEVSDSWLEHPRSARVNTIKISVEETLAALDKSTTPLQVMQIDPKCQS